MDIEERRIDSKMIVANTLGANKFMRLKHSIYPYKSNFLVELNALLKCFHSSNSSVQCLGLFCALLLTDTKGNQRVKAYIRGN